jgi:hypothetical protein
MDFLNLYGSKMRGGIWIIKILYNSGNISGAIKKQCGKFKSKKGGHYD